MFDRPPWPVTTASPVGHTGRGSGSRAGVITRVPVSTCTLRDGEKSSHFCGVAAMQAIAPCALVHDRQLGAIIGNVHGHTAQPAVVIGPIQCQARSFSGGCGDTQLRIPSFDGPNLTEQVQIRDTKPLMSNCVPVAVGSPGRDQQVPSGSVAYHDQPGGLVGAVASLPIRGRLTFADPADLIVFDQALAALTDLIALI